MQAAQILQNTVCVLRGEAFIGRTNSYWPSSVAHFPAYTSTSKLFGHMLNTALHSSNAFAYFRSLKRDLMRSFFCCIDILVARKCRCAVSTSDTQMRSCPERPDRNSATITSRKNIPQIRDLARQKVIRRSRVAQTNGMRAVTLYSYAPTAGRYHANFCPPHVCLCFVSIHMTEVTRRQWAASWPECSPCSFNIQDVVSTSTRPSKGKKLQGQKAGNYKSTECNLVSLLYVIITPVGSADIDNCRNLFLLRVKLATMP
jgi:hypothetical protein